ncbi:uncharacterized protein A1O9_04404 [Exophiala aquamarina CBS 119918]|uniref:Uncharacterized protein n=1 Tax=Exophiala aquamarina CBS 119918 TaxID=1182545 RepID=A0A072PHE1_9EURO|nr:uncharacterized protein A1O9_04404 [Exophiala aquamarina CBS 119918]KEF59559.1 hypothetical protein A1O9_04404 [Exophiala aquamarina CBS 119918]
MDSRVKVWIIGSIAAVFSVASSVLSVVFAYHLSDYLVLSALRVLLLVAFAISLLNLASIVCFCTLYAKRLSNHSLGLKARTWGLYSAGVAVCFVSIAVSGVTVVWLTLKRAELHNDVLGVAPVALIATWFGLWGASGIMQILLFYFLGMWTRVVLKSQRASRLDMDFGIRASMHDISRTNTHRTHRSFASQDVTLNSPPRTPVSRGESSTRRSSSTRVGPAGSSRTKLMRPSAKSSLEIMPFPAGEAASIDSAFDGWDTSSVHYEMRSAIHSSPPVTRGGLATIPGSRPESPANALDGPYLPSSPVQSSSPHAATSDTPTALGWSSSPRQPKSSPPSSPPPNFSRPTSSHNSSKPPPKFQKFDPSMDDLIHPLFRPNSPHPPPIATSGTMVTASPMADQLITPKTLARLRSNSANDSFPCVPQPDLERTGTMTTEESVPDSPTLGSDMLGSPGPSIVDDLELPPILPGFVLSAGSRSSLVEYGKRKSTKDRPKSHLSASSRLSELLP